jgi:hypothetical protein
MLFHARPAAEHPTSVRRPGAVVDTEFSVLKEGNMNQCLLPYHRQ